MRRLTHRRCGPAPHLLLLILTLSVCTAAIAADRHALVVGINLYVPDGAEQTAVVTDRGGWGNLEGAVDDARAMASLLEHRFGFPSASIEVLLDRDATRDAILDGLHRTLLERAKPGDTAVFFYAGHGSQVRNTASDELDGKDETLVPSDAWRGVPDIRDKELKRLLWRALENDVQVVFISDSCHSGSVTRGVAPPRARSLPPAPGSVNDDDDAPNPAAHPLAVILTATQPHQRAQEIDTDGDRRGALSWSLQRALTSLPVDAGARDVFTAARGLLRWRGVTQDPTLEGRSERLDAPLFGHSDDSKDLAAPARTVVAVDGVDDSVASLDGGLALGLNVGCELVPANGEGPRLRIDDIDVVSSQAGIVGSGDPEPGSLYEVVSWAPPPGDPLRFWMPAPVDGDTMGRSLRDATLLAGATLVSEPTLDPPTHSAWRGPEGWRLEGSGRRHPLRTAGDAQDHLDRNARLLVLAPPSRLLDGRLRDAFTLRPGAMELVDDPTRADYLLLIDPNDDTASWVNRSATVDDSACALPRRTHGVGLGSTAAAALTDQAARLARIRGWHGLIGPGDDPVFPYRLAGLRGADGRLRGLDEPVFGGESLSLVLKADEAGRRTLMRLARAYKATPRHLYVFAVDQQGNGFPLLHEVVQTSPRGRPPAEIVLRQPGQDFLVEVGEPYGTDTIFVLVTEEPLPSMDVFDFEGVGVRSAPVGASSPLADLLYGVGERRRGEAPSVPMNWSVQKVSVSSRAPAGN